MGKFKPFTEEEKRIIRQNYYTLGAVGVSSLLEGRSKDTIKYWAYKNNLKVSKEFKSRTATAINFKYKRNMSDETRKKIGDGHRKHPIAKCLDCGKRISHNTKRCWDCYSVDLSGSNNNNWRGGVASLRSLVDTMLWEVWKIPVLKRDDYQCQMCGKTGSLEVHHLRKYTKIRDKIRKLHPEISLRTFDGRKKLAALIILDHSIEDGISLCHECHTLVHRKKRGELQGNLTVKNEGNLQPSPPKLKLIVGGKVQRATLEDSATNKSDTSAPNASKAL